MTRTATHCHITEGNACFIAVCGWQPRMGTDLHGYAALKRGSGFPARARPARQLAPLAPEREEWSGVRGHQHPYYTRSGTSRDREGAGGMEPRMDTNEHECGRAKLRLSRSMVQHSMARLEHRAPTGKADQGPGAAGQQAANRFQPGQGRCTSRLRVR